MPGAKAISRSRKNHWPHTKRCQLPAHEHGEEVKQAKNRHINDDRDEGALLGSGIGTEESWEPAKEVVGNNQGKKNPPHDNYPLIRSRGLVLDADILAADSAGDVIAAHAFLRPGEEHGFWIELEILPLRPRQAMAQMVR